MIITTNPHCPKCKTEVCNQGPSAIHYCPNCQQVFIPFIPIIPPPDHTIVNEIKERETNMKPLNEMTEPELQELMVNCGKDIKKRIGPNSQFLLLVFDDPKIAQYISTCQRASMIEAMRETANRLEKKQDIPR